MKELNDRARTLLRATELADDPTDDDYDRIRSALAARIATTAVVGAAATLGAKTATAATGTTAAAGAATTSAAASIAPAAATGVTAGLSVASVPVMKVAAWVVAVSMTAGVGTAVVATQSRSSSPAQAIAAAPSVSAINPSPPEAQRVRPIFAETSAPAERGGKTLVVNEAPEAPAATASSRAGAPSLERPSSPRSAASPPSSVVHPVSVGHAPSSSLETEVALIRDARAAIQANDTAHAIALLEEHGRRFPSGAMAQDRDALQVFATCAAGQADAARELATQFLAQHPASSYAAAVITTCASKK